MTDVDARPQQASRQDMGEYAYQRGFGNEFASEAVAGALPAGRNSPQRAPLGLFAEQLSGTAFTQPRAVNRRTWVYRIMPSAAHPRFARIGAAALRERAATQAGTDVAGLYENLADFTLLAEVEEAHVAELSERVRPAPLVRVPFLPSDVHDLEGLAELGKYLFDGGEVAPVTGS